MRMNSLVVLLMAPLAALAQGTSMSFQGSMSYSYSFGCDITSCSQDVLLALGDQNQNELCAIDDLSCLSSCGSEWITAHCECDTGALFGSYSFDFRGEAYCCGDKTCKDSIVDLYVGLGFGDDEDITWYLGQDCGEYGCSYSYSAYSSSYSSYSLYSSSYSQVLVARSFSF